MLITRITHDNRSVFQNLIPAEQYAELDMPGQFALGAIGEDDRGQYAAGVLLFAVQEGVHEAGSDIAAELRWLYVAEECRRQGAADALMGELLRILDAAGITALLCDLPMDNDCDLLCLYLEAWGFRFRHMDRFVCSTTLGELLENPFFRQRHSTPVLPLSGFHANTLVQSVRKYTELPFVLQDLEAYLPQCDQDVSCGIWNRSSVEGLTLVRKLGGGGLELLLCRSKSQQIRQVMDMLLFAAGQAAKKYPPETTVRIDCRIGAAADLIAYFLPQAVPPMIRRGVLAIEEQDDTETEVTHES